MFYIHHSNHRRHEQVINSCFCGVSDIQDQKHVILESNNLHSAISSKLPITKKNPTNIWLFCCILHPNLLYLSYQPVTALCWCMLSPDVLEQLWWQKLITLKTSTQVNIWNKLRWWSPGSISLSCRLLHIFFFWNYYIIQNGSIIILTTES